MYFLPSFISALFLMRNDSFLNQLPEELKKDFIDENSSALEKLRVLKKHIDDRFTVCTILQN